MMNVLLSDGKYKKTPTMKKAKTAAPKDDEFKKTTFPCPGCDEPLRAREWKGDTMYQHRIEVLTSQGYILAKTSGCCWV